MIKTSQLNYFDKTGKKVFTYHYIDDPHFYDDDSNGCDNWVQAHIPLKAQESPKSLFYKMLLSHEILTARQLREFRQHKKEQLPIITVDNQMTGVEQSATTKAHAITKGEIGRLIEIYHKRRLGIREKE